ncbi:MAG: hypothetical protein IH600_09355 [Bacteroidetes bacterium]|nr:hypothetical protein [Bacteroidota bacterium]
MVPQTVRQSCSPTQIMSWNDLFRMCPQDPTDLIAYAEIGGVKGDLYLSSSYASQSWSASPLAVNGKALVSALETDNQLKVAEADQWNFSHLSWNDSSELPLPLRKIIFVRGGTQWENMLKFDFGGTNIEEVQISFLSNATTRGDKQGTIPVIRWTEGSWSGNIVLSLVTKKTGIYTLGIWTFDGANYAMFELVLMVVP